MAPAACGQWQGVAVFYAHREAAHERAVVEEVDRGVLRVTGARDEPVEFLAGVEVVVA